MTGMRSTIACPACVEIVALLPYPTKNPVWRCASVSDSDGTGGVSATRPTGCRRYPYQRCPWMAGVALPVVFALDFEFVSEPGARPVPVCLVARELGSDRLIRLWQDQLGAGPPFPIDDDTLFVAYFASAEIGCFLELGWPVPTRILDLYTEFRNATNGIPLPAGRGLLGALSHHGIPSITSEQKTEERALVMGGGPWTAAIASGSWTTARPTLIRSGRYWSACCRESWPAPTD